ncbi:hypothetical protein Ana3638_05200 [Anaerocolumna sedimenticola]|uniref:TadZ-like receiver domain-containing protein n=1 Tax=Anaerocolumna sedimenticola TaxID=2696063 RepID=A0A6P1TGC6_9FIRM|nr:hypothetical protein [Anaerocolumna sedimenticola]QHQ60250.1 hypothetical protein Ana3638_05200 [Anaerocolumna sedimenticola]
MSCTLAIYDSESDYANHLMDYLKRNQKKLTQIRVFTNLQSLKEYMGENSIPILVINESLPLDEINMDNIKNICILSEENTVSNHHNYPVIYKYQSAEIIMKELFSYFPEQLHQSNIKNSYGGKTKIISIFSMQADVMRQAFAFSLAEQYASVKKTLYINLDTYPALSELLGYKPDKGLSELIYFLKQNPSNLSNKIRGIITKRKNLDYIEGVSFGPDLFELTPEDIVLWLGELQLNADYDVILFDVGCYFHTVLELFRNSSQVLVFLEENGWDEVRYNVFKNQLSWSGYTDVLEKIKKVPVTEEVRGVLENRMYQHFDIETGNFNFISEYTK